MKEDPIKKMTRHGLIALGAILILVIALMVRGSEVVVTFIGGLALLGLYFVSTSTGWCASTPDRADRCHQPAAGLDDHRVDRRAQLVGGQLQA